MRNKIDGQPYLEFRLESSRKVVREYLAKYEAISQVLDGNPQILDRAHDDFKKLSERGDGAADNRDRSASYTSENLLRALIVLCVEQESYRDCVVRIDRTDCLKQFCRLGPRDVMDYSLLCRAFGALSPETLREMNRVLANHAVAGGLVDPSVVRTDTTVVETNIHYPTDVSLLWDCARVLIRLLREGRTLAPHRCNHRFHDKKIKRLSVAIARAHKCQSKGKKARISARRLKKYYRKLIADVQRLVDIAGPFAAYAVKRLDIELKAIGYAIQDLLPDVEKVISQSIRSKLNGEIVPARDRVFSIFEPHTELIKRGKARKPVEFGHKIILTETQETFITDYGVLTACPNDRNLAPEVVARHEELYGAPPEVLAGDAGFSPGEEKRRALEEIVDVLAIPRNAVDRIREDLVPWHHFRAGVEGTISVLKRAFRLFRCVYRGFNNFASNVGLGIFCHNLVLLARLRL
jgi:IS5 family transposase